MDPSQGEIEAFKSEQQRRFEAWEAREIEAYNARLRGALKSKAAADRKAERKKRDKEEIEKFKAEKIKLKENFWKHIEEARMKRDTKLQEAYLKAGRARKEATQRLEEDLKKGDRDADKAWENAESRDRDRPAGADEKGNTATFQSSTQDHMALEIYHGAMTKSKVNKDKISPLVRVLNSLTCCCKVNKYK